jgi:hypothetical protein
MRSMSTGLRSVIVPLIVILLCSCSDSSGNGVNESTVGFQVTSSYFVKNTYAGETNPSYLLIRSYSSFDSVFGVAVVGTVDPSKMITEDKMKNGFILSVIYKGNNIHKFNIDNVILKNGQLQVNYTSEVTEPNATWTCNCHVTVLIDKCNFDSILLFENGNALPHAPIKEL